MFSLLLSHGSSWSLFSYFGHLKVIFKVRSMNKNDVEIETSSMAIYSLSISYLRISINVLMGIGVA